MIKTKTILCVGLAVIALGVAGCRYLHNESAGPRLAPIQSQPSDTMAKMGEEAVFEVKVKGTEPIYQWYHDGVPVTDAHTKGGRTSRLTVLDSGSQTWGAYWCEIDVKDPVWGQPFRTRTRMAMLNDALPKDPQKFSLVSVRSFGTNDIPPTPGNPPPGNGGNSPCGGSYCTYVIYNNGGNGYQPVSSSLRYVAKVSAPLGAYFPNTAYDLLRSSGLLDSVCATNIGTIEKGRGSAATKKHVFTVYFKPGPTCPPVGTTCYLEVDWQP